MNPNYKIVTVCLCYESSNFPTHKEELFNEVAYPNSRLASFFRYEVFARAAQFAQRALYPGELPADEANSSLIQHLVNMRSNAFKAMQGVTEIVKLDGLHRIEFPCVVPDTKVTDSCVNNFLDFLGDALMWVIACSSEEGDDDSGYVKMQKAELTVIRRMFTAACTQFFIHDNFGENIVVNEPERTESPTGDVA